MKVRDTEVGVDARLLVQELDDPGDVDLGLEQLLGDGRGQCVRVQPGATLGGVLLQRTDVELDGAQAGIPDQIDARRCRDRLDGDDVHELRSLLVGERGGISGGGRGGVRGGRRLVGCSRIRTRRIRRFGHSRRGGRSTFGAGGGRGGAAAGGQSHNHTEHESYQTLTHRGSPFFGALATNEVTARLFPRVRSASLMNNFNRDANPTNLKTAKSVKLAVAYNCDWRKTSTNTELNVVTYNRV